MKTQTLNQIDGVLAVDKPQDWTSHDVCAFVKKRFKIKKVGHAGTLDPLATGLLVLLLGKATRSSMALSQSDKAYEGKFKLGIETGSHDITGEVLQESPWEDLTLEAIKEKAKEFEGDLEQIPPMVSALKHKGVPLYKLARKGKTVEREARPIRVQDFDIKSKEGPLVSFSVYVSKGTYVRTLAHDLAKSLGSAAALAELRRTESGRLNVQNAITIEQLKEMSLDDFKSLILPIYSVLPYESHNES